MLRTLTAVTVILMPLTLLTGFFGMNVDFPGQEHGALYFWGIVGTMLWKASCAMAAAMRRCRCQGVPYALQGAVAATLIEEC